MKQVAVADPALVADAYLRQILQALRHNQIELFRSVGVDAGSATVATETPKAAKLPVRSAGSAGVTAVEVNFSLPADATAGNVAGIAALANANKAALLALAGEYNKLHGDVAALVAVVKNLQGQQAELVNRLNQGV
ncbi:hypothetical protein [Thiothrix winogradskyi]|uniref:Uncharacterized protein n=1 Tax=Thiothrix winogradskyi TaxID=96472 RepID=A0ABY3T6W6_9GAMM|nr:hypothetical protein [Thiothrix winogradskyi]UJS26289.1 hypothetical protein L2Y54_09680 [Thiothrix winogradskyi]